MSTGPKVLAALLLLLLPAASLASPPNGPAYGPSYSYRSSPSPSPMPADVATLSLQFDNTQKSVSNPSNNPKIIKVLAEKVFQVPEQRVKVIAGLDQSGMIFGSQSVITYQATGPAFNKKTVLENCNDAVKSTGSWFGSSLVQQEVGRVTDTWWPGDRVKVQKATCAQGNAQQSG